MIPDLNLLDTLDGYRQYFMDEALWRPHVQRVCQRHGLLPCEPVRAGLAGSCPTFIVAQRWVVKFYGRLFGGGQSYRVEYEVGRLLPPDLAIPVPAIIEHGILAEDDPVWGWPYLIFEYIPGVSIGEVYESVPIEDKLLLARQLGETNRQLQRLSLEGVDLFGGGRGAYSQFLQTQRTGCQARQAEWGSWPEHLLAQIDSFLPDVETLTADRFPFGLIHADLTRDHILGRLEGGRWITLGLIDFGDARPGNVLYDLTALHLDLFCHDKRLLQTYLEAYGLMPGPDFPRLALSAALLHQFNVFVNLFDELPEARQMKSLDDLAELVWGK